MIVVHHLEHSRSQRILWLLEELGLDYEIVRYARDPATLQAPPALRRIHPLGKSPVLVDGELTLAESGAIVEYLAGRYGGGGLLPPADSPERLRCTYWLHFAEGSAMPPLLLKLIFARLATAPMAFFARPVARRIAATLQQRLVDPQIARQLDYLEGELTAHDWFAGPQFSAADIQMSFPVEAAAARAGLDAGRPRLWDWLQRIHQRPAYRRALERGGPYRLLGE